MHQTARARQDAAHDKVNLTITDGCDPFPPASDPLAQDGSLTDQVIPSPADIRLRSAGRNAGSAGTVEICLKSCQSPFDSDGFFVS